MKPAPATLGGSEISATSSLPMIVLRYFARILAALFREHHRGVALVVAETRIGRRRNFAGEWQPRGRKCFRKLPRK